MAVVALTGSSGYVGRAIAAELTRAGHVVRRLARSDGERVDVVGDVRDRDACDELVRGAQHVVHAAGLVRSGDRQELESINVGGTRTLADAARAGGLERFIHISTTGIHGLPGRAVHEPDRPSPATAYETSKARAEEAVATVDIDSVIIRPSNVIGPSHPLRPLRRLMARAARGGALISAGAWANYIGVDSVAATAARALGRGAPSVVIVNDPMPLRELYRLLLHATCGSARVVDVPAAAHPFLHPLLRRVGAASRLSRLRALSDPTRFETVHAAWFESEGIECSVAPVLQAMAVENGQRALA